MSMVSALFEYGISVIHYRHFGKGPFPIVALHGYGESSASFEFLQDWLGANHCLIAIDLPFHGLTKWHEKRTFTCTDLICILNGIFENLGIPDVDFHVLGFSMGGRLALSLVENVPERVSRVLLIAPDGMKVNFWYWLATQTRAGNRLFLFTMKNPAWFFYLLRLCDKFNLINKSIYKFIYTYLHDEKFRMELYHRWTCMRHFKPDLGKVKFLICQKNMAVRLLYGKHDRIIVSATAQRFSKGLEPFCQLHIINAGHQLLHRKYADIISKLLTT